MEAIPLLKRVKKVCEKISFDTQFEGGSGVQVILDLVPDMKVATFWITPS